MRTMLLITTALALAPAGLAAQAAEGSESGQARIEAAMQAAARAEIPASLLESKVKEGRAKGVAEARIASAVESRLEALVQARDAMREAEIEAVTAGELSVAADALQAGVSEEALVEVAREAPAERRAVATAVLTSLVQLGVVSEQAEVRVQQALSRGPEALANLRAEVAAQLRLRGGPGIGGLGLGASGGAAGGGGGASGGLIHLN